MKEITVKPFNKEEANSLPQVPTMGSDQKIGCFMNANCCAATPCLKTDENGYELAHGKKLPYEFVLDHKGKLGRNHCDSWLGADDFSAIVRTGWNSRGMCLDIRVTDSDIVNDMPENDLWMKDCVEVFFAPAEEKRFGKNDASFTRVQLVIAPPDENGAFRSQTYFYGGQGEFPFEVEGQRTPTGYAMRLLLPWDSFGDYDVRKEKLFKFQLCVNDYDRRDGTTYYPRAMNLTGTDKCLAMTSNYPLFRLDDSDTSPENVSLELLWDPAVPVIASTNSLEVEIPLPDFLDSATADILRADGSEFAHLEFPSGKRKAVFSGLDSFPDTLGVIRFVAFKNTRIVGVVSRGICFISGYIRTLGQLDFTKMTPEHAAWWMTCVSAVEFLKLAAIPSSCCADRLEDAAAECACRFAMAQGRPLPENAPGKFKYLELARGLNSQTAVSYSRNSYKPEFIAISLSWGNLACMNAEICCYDTEQKAQKYLDSQTAFFSPLPPPEIPGTDSVFLGRGHLLGDGLKDDMQPERLVTLFSPDRPGEEVRLVPEDAFCLPVEAVAFEQDAPEEMCLRVRAFAKERNLPEIHPADVAKHQLTLIAGTPTSVTADKFWHSRNGIPSNLLFIRQSRFAILMSFNMPEQDLEFASFLLNPRPVSRETIRRFALARAATLPAFNDEDRIFGTGIRTGDVHTHSIYSDGQSTPAGMIANTPSVGLDFMVLTDHHRVEGAFELDRNMRKHRCGLNFVIGEEITMAPKYHINLYPLTRFVSPNQNYPQLYAEARKMNAIIQFDHPMRYGTDFSECWYGDISQAGFDAVERRVEYLERWRASGKPVPALVGGTDTHMGIFGYNNFTAAWIPEFSGDGLADAVRSGLTAMIDPLMPDYAYGSEKIRQGLAAILSDPDSPEIYGKRLLAALTKFNAAGFVLESPVETNLQAWWDTTIDKTYLEHEDPATLRIK